MNTMKRSSRLAAAALGSLPFFGHAAHAAGPFDGFAGNWRGGGTITMTSGSQERIRCKGRYGVRSDNRAMSIDLLCASDSYKVNIVSNIVAQGSSFSGQWQETTRQVQGSVTGTSPGPGQIQASLEGTGFGMQFSARVGGHRQELVLRAEGTEVQSVTISLSR